MRLQLTSHFSLLLWLSSLTKDVTSAVMMAASVGLHQPAETLALLVALLKSGMTRQEVVWYMSLFSVVGPLSTALGIAINKFANPKLDAVLVAVTAGTFLYMSCTEIANDEFADDMGVTLSSTQRYSRLGAMLSGVVTILALAKFAARWESPDESETD